MAPPQYFLDLCDLFDLLTLTMVEIQQTGCIFLLFSSIRSFWAIDGPNRLTSTSNSFLSIRVPLLFHPMAEKWVKIEVVQKNRPHVELYFMPRRIVRLTRFLRIWPFSGSKSGVKVQKRPKKRNFYVFHLPIWPWRNILRFWSLTPLRSLDQW